MSFLLLFQQIPSSSSEDTEDRQEATAINVNEMSFTGHEEDSGTEFSNTKRQFHVYFLRCTTLFVLLQYRNTFAVACRLLFWSLLIQHVIVIPNHHQQNRYQYTDCSGPPPPPLHGYPVNTTKFPVLDQIKSSYSHFLI